MKKILVILQNAYGVEDGYIPDYSRESFRNSFTGKRLKEMLPDNIDVRIVNSNPNIGKDADSYFKPDYQYVEQKINEIKPDLILACGVNGKAIVDKLNIMIPTIKTFHPAYRALSKEITAGVKKELANYI